MQSSPEANRRTRPPAQTSMNLRLLPALVRQEESAATAEKRDQREDGDREQDRVNDHAACDRDDEKHNTKNQKHELALPAERARQPRRPL